MNNRLILSAAVSISMLLGACSKESGTVTPDTGTAETGMSFQLRATNTSSSINQRATAGGVIQWTSGYAYPTQVKLEAKQQNTKIEYKSTNNSRIDLFAPVPTDFGSLVLPAGTYKEIELKLRLDDPGADAALYLAGTYTNNGLVLPVVFRIDEDVTLKTELKDVTIDNNTNVAALTELELASYMGGITDAMIQNATLTNGTLIISRDFNRNLYNIILGNLSGKRHKCHYNKHK